MRVNNLKELKEACETLDAEEIFKEVASALSHQYYYEAEDVHFEEMSFIDYFNGPIIIVADDASFEYYMEELDMCDANHYVGADFHSTRFRRQSWVYMNRFNGSIYYVKTDLFKKYFNKEPNLTNDTFITCEWGF